MKISVVMAVHNGEAHIRDAVASILNQTLSPLELIVVDDGSTDATPAILASFDDPRLSTTHLPTNCGIATARNVGMALVRGDYLAVMDADDVCLPQRLAMQSAFMDRNPQVHILGSRIVRTAEDIGTEIDRPAHPLSDGDIKANLLLLNGSAMIHPTMMARMSFIQEHSLLYPPPPRGRVGIDHEFWIGCVAKGAVFENLPDALLLKRRHGGNVTLLNRDQQVSGKKALSRAHLLSLYYPDLSMREVRALASILAPGAQLKAMDVSLGLAAGQKALRDTTSHHGESKTRLQRILEEASSRWLNALTARDRR